MSVMRAKVPAGLATGIICFLIGGGIGAVVMAAAVAKPEPLGQGVTSDDAAKGPGGGGGGGAKGEKGDKGGKGGKGGGGGGGGAGRGPGPKVQLTQLVAKLDALTRESLHVELTPDQKKEAKALLAGLSETDAITDEDAKAKLDALLKLLETHRKTLEAAGYWWPGSPPPGTPAGGGLGGPVVPPPNPFKDGDAADRLKALQATLGK